MDERTVGMTSPGADEASRQNGTSPANAAETAAQLEDDIENIRNHLTDVASELDRRRHRFFDLPGQVGKQVRKHAKPLAIGTVGLAALGLGIWWWRSRSRKTIPGRLMSLLPDNVASSQWFEDARKRVAEAIHPAPASHPVRSGLFRISTAGAAAAASVLGKRLAVQLARDRWPTPDQARTQERKQDRTKDRGYAT